MKIPNSSNARREPLQVEMTPMIDVVFLLLIFFIWTASFQIAEQRLPTAVALPGEASGSTVNEEAAEELDFERVVVRMLWENDQVQWLVNGESQADLAAVRERLAAVGKIRNDLPVVVDPVEAVPLGDVIDVYDVTRGAGFDTVEFAASQ